MKNSRGQKLLDTFRALPGVHFIHTIFHFESQEFRSPTLQTVCKSELKRRSYGRLKTTASSCAKFRNYEMSCENFAAQSPFRKVFRSCKTTCKHTCATSQVGTPFSQLRTKLRNHLQAANQVANHLQVVKSPPSCEITNSTCKIKVQI